jgi:hypothetical protein
MVKPRLSQGETLKSSATHTSVAVQEIAGALGPASQEVC